jgi:metal transporter CNNM
MLGDRFNGVVAATISTLMIVIFGEVLPQALFSRFALSFTSFFAPLLRLMILVTYPIAKPLQLLLDAMIGHEKSHLHTRSELGIIINEHYGRTESELDEDEVEIIKNTLLLSKKQAHEIMTPIKKVYWVKPTTRIGPRKIEELKMRHWSRIPVFNEDRSICFGLLLTKDLVDIDFDERPRVVSELPLHPTKPIGSKTALDTLFRKFIGSRTHLMPVERNGTIIGIVTIEDLVEEIIGHEIEDELDHIKQDYMETKGAL